MWWWTLTYLDNDRSQTGLVVVASTNHPAHLFMAWATHEPRRKRRYMNVRGKSVPCGWIYIWDTPNLVEQDQSLDTFEHTFVTTPLQPHDHVWYYLFSTKKFYDRYCQSPLIHVPPPEIEMASARIFHSVNQPCPTDVFTILSFDSFLWDNWGFHDPADPTKLTMPLGALYAFGAGVRLATGTAMRCSLSIRINASHNIAYHGHQVSAVDFGGGRLSVHGIMAMRPDDFIQCRIYHTAGLDRDVVATPEHSPHFWAAHIGAYPIMPP